MKRDISAKPVSDQDDGALFLCFKGKLLPSLSTVRAYYLFLENHYIFSPWLLFFLLIFNSQVFLFDVLCTFTRLQVSG